MAGERKITVTFDGKDVGLGKAADEAGDDVERAGNRFGDTGKILAGGLLGGATLAAGGLFAVGKAAADEQQSMSALNVTMKNSVKATDEQVAAQEAHFEALQRTSGVVDDDLRTAFTALIGTTKDTAQANDLLNTSMDIAAAKGISVADASEIITAAKRGEMDAIESLGIATEDANGEARDFNAIMADTNAMFEGQSAAAADTVTGKFQILKTRLGEAGEDLGAKLLPAALAVGNWLTGSFVPAITAAADWMGKNLGPAVSDVARFMRDDLVPAIGPVVETLTGIGSWVAENEPVLIGLGVAIGVGLVVAFTAWAVSAASAAAATIAATWPVLAIGAAIAALVAGVIWAYQNWDWFRTSVDAVARVLKENVWPAIKTGIDWIGKIIGVVVSFGLAVARIVGPVARNFFDMNAEIGRLIGGAISLVASLPGKVSGALSSLANAIAAPFRSGFQSIKDGWNNTIGGKGFSLPGIPGITKGIDFKIPKLAGGGLAFGPTLAMVGDNAGAYRDPEVIAPLSKLQGMVGGGGEMVHVQVVIDSQVLFDAMRKGVRNRGGLQKAFG